MEFNFDKAKWHEDSEGIWLSILIPKDCINKVKKFIAELDKLHTCVIKRHRNKRSLDANGYMWVILRAMAEKLRTTDKEIYKEMIRRVGQVTILPVKDEAIETFIKRWEANGDGWQVDVIGECRNTNGYSNLRCYYGSSVYDIKEFSVLLDEVITEAKELGIDTATPEEIERLKQQYGEKDKV
jgi:hypothetical protein